MPSAVVVLTASSAGEVCEYASPRYFERHVSYNYVCLIKIRGKYADNFVSLEIVRLKLRRIFATYSNSLSLMS